MDMPETIWAKCEDVHGAIQVGGWADTVRQYPDGTQYRRADLPPRVKLLVWQPIETAPKGDEIMAWDSGGEIFIAFWHGKRQKWLWTTHDLGGDEGITPTHWMPLPAPPEATE